MLDMQASEQVSTEDSLNKSKPVIPLSLLDDEEDDSQEVDSKYYSLRSVISKLTNIIVDRKVFESYEYPPCSSN